MCLPKPGEHKNSTLQVETYDTANLRYKKM